MKALDMSFGAASVTPAWCARRLAEGYELLICDLWTGNRQIPEAVQALRYWREAGGLIAAYFVVHNGRPAAEHLAQAHGCAGDEWDRLAFLAIDVEVDPTSPAAVTVARGAVQAAGLRPLVYTSVSKWRALCRDVPDLADTPLWDAKYGQAPSLEMQPSYGGWQRRTGHQYQNTTRIDGVDCDISLFDDAFVRAGDGQEEEGDLTAQEQDEARQLLDVLWGWSLELGKTSPQGQHEQQDAIIRVKTLIGLNG